MKRFIIAFVIVFAVAAQLFAVMANDSKLDSMWERANKAYVAEDFPRAIEIYDSIADAGYESHKLYYNLGNAYFKDRQMGLAILYYNRALQLKPSDRDIRHNLKVANTQIVDKIEVLPEIALVGFVKGVRRSLSSNTWAVVSLCSVALMLAGVLLYLMSRSFRLRKGGFWGAVVMLGVSIFAISFAAINRDEQLHSSDAIVMLGAAPVKSSPDINSKDIFILHEGTKVAITDAIGEWYEIIIADGNKGWILKDSIEKIYN